MHMHDIEHVDLNLVPYVVKEGYVCFGGGGSCSIVMMFLFILFCFFFFKVKT